MPSSLNYEALPFVPRSLEAGPWRGLALSLEGGLCGSPLCPCLRLRVRAASAVPGVAEVVADAGVEVHLGSLEEPNGADRGPRELVGEVLSGLSLAEWRQVVSWWAARKEAQFAMAKLAHLEARFPDEVLKDPATLVGYHEVVPSALGIPFEHEGRPWAAVDDYCVNPECECTRVRFTFVPLLPEGDGEEAAAYRVPSDGTDLPSLSYDYASGAREASEATDPQAPCAMDLLASLEAHLGASHEAIIQGSPGAPLASVLEIRHHRLRILYLVMRVGLHQSRSAVPTFVRGEAKVGRNDPCPCGSGRKFKKCCGA